MRSPSLSLAALAAVLLAVAPLRSLAQDAGVPLPPAGTSSARLGALETAYVQNAFREQPTFATQAGIHSEDGRLPDLSAAGFARRAAASQRELAALDALERSGEPLSAEDAVDVAIMRAALRREILDDQTEQRWRHEPAQYTSTASYAVYGLFSREFAPLGERARATIARERAIPALLAAGKANVTTVDATTALIAKLDIAGAVSFFRTTVPEAFAALDDAALRAQLAAANAAAVAALQDYAAFMNAGPLAHPSGTYAIGARSYAARLALQEGRAIPLDVYERVGQQALDQTKADFVATARRIDPAKPAYDVYQDLSRAHPSNDALLSTAQNLLGQLRAFVVAKHLVTLPAEFDVQVRETPVFGRQTSFASMNTPGPFEHVATQAYYYVTPADPSWTPRQQRSTWASTTPTRSRW